MARDWTGIAPEHRSDSDGRDAVCFTAGFAGVPFGAGVIHAYLASDSRPPKVVAGVSLGTLSAAAMQRSYRALADLDDKTHGHLREAARWTWFRKYLAYLLDRPLDAVWAGIPDVSDLLAPRAPIQDLAAPGPLADEETDARRDYYLTIKLSRWLGRLPVRVSMAANFVVCYVRWKEGYGGHPVWRYFQFAFHRAVLALAVVWHVARSPQFLNERQFRTASGITPGRGFRPLFGWLLWLSAVALMGAVGAILYLIGGKLWSPPADGWAPELFGLDPAWLTRTLIAGSTAAAALVLMCLVEIFGLAGAVRRWWRARNGKQEPAGQSTWSRSIAGWALHNAKLKKALLHEYHLRLRLFRLFAEDDGQLRLLGDHPMPALLIATPLQLIASRPGRPEAPAQLWASNERLVVNSNAGPQPPAAEAITVVQALIACLALPPLYEPVEQSAANARLWLRPDNIVVGGKLELVDASVVRRNPLPALFNFLKDQNQLAPGSVDDVYSRTFQDVRVHLVYDVPIDPKPIPPRDTLSDPKTALEPLPNSVDAARKGLVLAKRRDSRLEVWQTNFLTRLEISLRAVTGNLHRPPAFDRDRPGAKPLLPVLVDEIAPDKEFAPVNALKPTESEILRHVAAGCRRTLAVLYQRDLLEFGGGAPVACPEFLARPRISRNWSGAPGVEEVCRHCTQKIEPSEQPKLAIDRANRLLPPSFVQAATRQELGRHFPQWDPERNPALGPAGATRLPQQIVFIASGGVFRGAFHIGMIGAMTALRIKPDIVVGASVGTLMGAALAATAQASPAEARKLLASLTDLFLHVDQRVALTKTLKVAARDLGIRARAVDLSPARIRRLVRRGSARDAGFAATGAPPALIDAISTLFMIPYKHTAGIAANFVAGDISGAVKDFLIQLRDETVPRLGIRDAAVGSSLLEMHAPELFGRVDRSSPQPYSEGPHPVAFFATTVNLVEEWTRVFGADLGRQYRSYDFVEAALGSAAFPAVFAARRDSAIYPLEGRRDVFYGDGGMFDNLPFLPAMMILAEARKSLTRVDAVRGWEELRRRWESPDLFLVGALDVDPQPGGVFDSILAIHRRAGALSRNEKTRGFERMMEAAEKAVGYYLEAHPALPADAAASQLDRERAWENLNMLSIPAVVPVFPASGGHLNPTFGFCRSLGLRESTVAGSIANGCFETNSKLHVIRKADPVRDVCARSLAALGGRVPRIQLASGQPDGAHCPWFRVDGPLLCPFEGTAVVVHAACSRDPIHKEKHRALVNRKPTAEAAAGSDRPAGRDAPGA